MGHKELTPEQRCSAEPRGTAELLRVIQDDPSTPEAEYAGAVLQFRGSGEELAAAAKLYTSADLATRQMGVWILGQLGWQQRTCLKESVDLLLEALEDPCDAIVADAAMALGHRRDVRAVAPLLKLVRHWNADVRLAALHGLLPHEEPMVIQTWVRLSGDADRDVRDWATFALQTHTEFDSEEIRGALVARLADEDEEIRGQAMIGLAERGDERVLEPLIGELGGEVDGDWAFEAAAVLGDARLYGPLLRARARLSGDDYQLWRHYVEEAIQRCCRR